jgi:hypothetical protein
MTTASAIAPFRTFVAATMIVSFVQVALAGREQAERIHDRLAGVPPSDRCSRA